MNQTFDAEPAAQRFVDLVRSTGYAHFYQAFGDGNLRQMAWRMHAWRLAPPTSVLVRLFLLQDIVEKQELAAILGDDLVSWLAGLNLVEMDADRIKSKGYLLVSFNSLMLFCEFKLHPSVYFGGDSMALGIYQTRIPGGVTLDLCSGTGIQAMLSALHARKSIAVEADARAAQIAEVNVLMNRLHNRVEIVNTRLEDFASHTGQHYNLVSANPPFEPTPPEFHGPGFASGGADGLDVVDDIVRLYASSLLDSGVIEVIGIGLGHDGNHGFCERFGSMAARSGCVVSVFITGTERLESDHDPYDRLVESFSLFNRRPMSECYEICAAHWKKLGVNEMHLYFARFSRASETGSPGVLDLSGSRFKWFSM